MTWNVKMSCPSQAIPGVGTHLHTPGQPSVMTRGGVAKPPLGLESSDVPFSIRLTIDLVSVYVRAFNTGSICFNGKQLSENCALLILYSEYHKLRRTQKSQ